MEFSKKLIEEREGSAEDKNIIFVTTNYHVFRSGVWAGLANLRAEGLGSDTKWWFWPNAFIRECVGLLANRIVPEVIILSSYDISASDKALLKYSYACIGTNL